MRVNLDKCALPSEGIVLINKPAGPTSHDIVAAARRATGVKRIGHAGTLDPFAEGLLVVLIGRDFTKKQAEFLGLDKTYEATIILGATSDTEDSTGVITPFLNPKIPNLEAIRATLAHFTKTYDQMPSAFSAKKIEGKKAYELARAGIAPQLSPKTITIHSLELLGYDYPELKIRTTVSSGTYIRALARDIGNALGCGAYVQRLKRTAIGELRLENACDAEIA